jgi:pimeloyl-ACP methyl ester carboxylesterase
LNRPTNSPSVNPIDPLAPQQPLASMRWLLGAFAAVLLLAVVSVYATFCLLFWQGQWQLVFHPSRTLTATPASAGLAFDEIRFDATETGTLQLYGWWVPAEQATRTVLLLHDGDGSLSNVLDQVQALHTLGLNVFAFDYRGFGNSLNVHPSEASTHADADAAWSYLTETRHLAPSRIILYGIGLGAAVAAEAAHRHPEAAALILENPRPPLLQTLQFDARTRLLPIRLLFHDRFDATKTLSNLRTPKITLDRDEDYLPRLRSFLQH